MSGKLLLLPGIACTAAVWRDVVRDLPDGGTRAETLELPPADTVDGMAQAILATAPERFALAGHSLGGYVALAIVAAAPARVTRLALVSTGATADPPAARPNREALIALAAGGQYDLVPDRLAPFMLPAHRRDDPALRDTVRAMARACGADRFIQQQRATMARPDRGDLLPAIRVPVLVAVGDQDRITPPPFSRAIAAAVPGAALHEVADAGHLLPLEEPAALAGLISAWLAQGASP